MMGVLYLFDVGDELRAKVIVYIRGFTSREGYRWDIGILVQIDSSALHADALKLSLK